MEAIVSDSSPRRSQMIWQVVVLGAAMIYYCPSGHESAPQRFSDSAAKFDRLMNKINPNVDPWWKLVYLPGIGIKRAKDIVGMRQASVRKPAFVSLEDMDAIRGIGPKMLKKMSPLITFEESPSSIPVSAPENSSNDSED